jgi:hypothetical protein
MSFIFLGTKHLRFLRTYFPLFVAIFFSGFQPSKGWKPIKRISTAIGAIIHDFSF